MAVPPIIHQTWKTTAIPPRWQSLAAGWKAQNPAFGYWFWTDEDIARLVAGRYPELLPLFEAYAQPIARVDLGRYLILRTFGGVYVDLDCECLRPIQPLLGDDPFVIGLEPAEHEQEPKVRQRGLRDILCPSFIASVPGHPFWDHLLGHLWRARHSRDVLDATGPFLLTRAARDYAGPAIARRPARLVYPVSKTDCWSGRLDDPDFRREALRDAYLLHYWDGSWFRPRAAEAGEHAADPECEDRDGPSASASSVAFVTTCKNRLHHLQQTLPRMLDARPDEIIVVDYGCPQGAAAWVRENHPGVRVVEVNDDPGFCLARARNQGALTARSDWLFFVDADVRVGSQWMDWFRRNASGPAFYRAAPVAGTRDRETWGTVLCDRRSFQTIGGYDEAFRGWGGEDDDLYERLVLAGTGEREYPGHYVEAIRHDDRERTQYAKVRDTRLQHVIHRFYTEAKLKAMMVGTRGSRPRRQPALDSRLALMSKMTDVVLAWAEDPTRPLPMTEFQIEGIKSLPGPYALHMQGRFRLAMVKPDEPRHAGRRQRDTGAPEDPRRPATDRRAAPDRTG